MRARSWLLIATFVVGAGSLATARADSVFVGWREIKGEIAEETSDYVVLRTGAGTITIARKEITKVVHEDEATTLLNEARAIARYRDKKALDLFDRAVVAFRKKGDPDGAALAAKERVSLASRLDRDAGRRALASDAPGDDRLAGDDLFLLTRDKEEVQIHLKAHEEGDANAAIRAANRLNELGLKHLADHEARWAVGCFALARDVDSADAKAFFESENVARRKACGAAVLSHDGRLALAAIAPIVKELPKDPRIAYLEARSFEVSGRPTDAGRSYRRALEGVAIPGIADVSNDLLCAFTRMLLSGKPPVEGAPGFGPSWTRVESAHFVVYHQLGDLFRDDEVRFYEESRDKDLVKLEISENDVAKIGRLPLFLFKDQAAYRSGGGETWAAGHSTMAQLEDGQNYMISTFPGRRMNDAGTIPHELGHIFVREAFPEIELPDWANEGVATYCEPDEIQAQRRALAARVVAVGAWKPLGVFFGRVTLDRGDDNAIGAFYSESNVAFAQLVESAGGVKAALRLAARMARKGVGPALKELNLDEEQLDAQLRAKLAKQP